MKKTSYLSLQLGLYMAKRLNYKLQIVLIR